MGELYLAGTVLSLIFGIIIGSFLNVCIYRIPNKIKVYDGYSKCPVCSTRLKALDLIPILSFAALRAKCRYCGCKISFIYPVVEILSGILFALAFYIYGISFTTVIVWNIICVLIVASFIDIASLEIPDGASVWLAALGIVSFFIPGLYWWQRLLGAFAGSLPLFLIFLATKGSAMGMGDIKLMFAAGLILGYKNVLFALFCAVIFGSVIGIILIASKKKGKKDTVPFVPMLSFGILLSLFFGSNIIDWYISILL